MIFPSIAGSIAAVLSSRRDPKKKKPKCPHRNLYLHREGPAGTFGRVKCLDCGYEREKKR